MNESWYFGQVTCPCYSLSPIHIHILVGKPDRFIVPTDTIDHHMRVLDTFEDLLRRLQVKTLPYGCDIIIIIVIKSLEEGPTRGMI